MSDILSPLCFILALIVIGCLERYIVGSRLFDRVSWCMSVSYNGWWKILNDLWSNEEQSQSFLDMIPDKYRINFANKDEINAMKTIALAYERNLSSLYFHKHLEDNWKRLRLTKEQFFVLTFHEFLEKNYDKDDLDGHELLSYQYEKSSSSAGVYSLTGLAVVLYKMLYATNIYRSNSKIDAINCTDSLSETIAKGLDTRQVKFYYR